MPLNLNTQVIIVGAGPTGLMSANQLIRFGIDFIILDKKNGPTSESRAIVVTARSLEIYQQMGIAKDAVKNGKIINDFNLYANGKNKAHIEIGQIGKNLSEFSYVLAFEQSKNETLLANNIVSQGYKIHWGYEFIKLVEHQEQVVAKTRHKNQDIYITAQYIIGCEGAKSPLRHQLNFSFKGGTYEQKFFVADTLLEWDIGNDQLNIFPGDQNFCALLPLTGQKNYRIIGTLPQVYAARNDITFNDIKDTVKRTIGMDVKFEKENWFSTYKLHHRSVNNFSQNRVFLAGDSAHIHSPAGGQGMNTGLQDAYNLCWKLALVLKGQAHTTLLNTYNEERLPFAKWLLRFTDRAFNLMASNKWYIRFFRKYIGLAFIEFILKSKNNRPKFFKIISQTGYSYNKSSLSKSYSKQKLVFKAGDRLPFFSENNIYLLFKEPCFHLLYINNLIEKTQDEEKINKLFPFPIKLIEQKLNNEWKKLGASKALWVLVRPDNYLALIMDHFDESIITDYLKTYFNTSAK